MNFKLIDFHIFGDERGSLVSLEANKNIPFDIKRVYYIFDTNKLVLK
ncbi:MAG: WxcM-like domain-containing protein [Rickettsiales bacterium]